MRIVHISSAGISLEGGMSRISHHWLSAFARRGIETISIDPSNTKICKWNSMLDISLRHAGRSILRRDDILLVHEPLSGAFCNLGYPVVLFSHGIEERIREVWRIHSVYKRSVRNYLTLPLWWRQWTSVRQGIKKADILLLSNKTDLRYIKRLGVKGKAIVFRNGTTTHHFTLEEKHPKTPRILFLGTWIQRKGTRLLKEVYQATRNSGRSIAWRFAGIGIDENRLRRDLGAENDPAVEVLSSFSAEMEGEVFKNCEIFVLPSYSEGQPLALLEAMGRGLCCITTDADGQRDLIADRCNGLLFPIGDRIKFLKLVEEAVCDRALRLRLGESASRSVQDRCWTQVSDEVVDSVLSSC